MAIRNLPLCKPCIVLIHTATANQSSWRHVRLRLLRSHSLTPILGHSSPRRQGFPLRTRSTASIFPISLCTLLQLLCLAGSVFCARRTFMAYARPYALTLNFALGWMLRHPFLHVGGLVSGASCTSLDILSRFPQSRSIVLRFESSFLVTVSAPRARNTQRRMLEARCLKP